MANNYLYSYKITEQNGMFYCYEIQKWVINAYYFNQADENIIAPDTPPYDEEESCFEKHFLCDMSGDYVSGMFSQ